MGRWLPMVSRRGVLGIFASVGAAGCAGLDIPGSRSEVNIEKILIENWLENHVTVAVIITQTNGSKKQNGLKPLFSSVIEIAPQKNNRVGTVLLEPGIRNEGPLYMVVDTSVRNNSEPEGYIHTGENGNECFSIQIDGAGSERRPITPTFIPRKCDDI